MTEVISLTGLEASFNQDLLPRIQWTDSDASNVYVYAHTREGSQTSGVMPLGFPISQDAVNEVVSDRSGQLYLHMTNGLEGIDYKEIWYNLNSKEELNEVPDNLVCSLPIPFTGVSGGAFALLITEPRTGQPPYYALRLSATYPISGGIQWQYVTTSGPYATSDKFSANWDYYIKSLSQGGSADLSALEGLYVSR